MPAPTVSPHPSPLPSIMGRPPARTHSPLRGLSFHENVPTAEVVAPVSPAPPTPSGILLNKFRFDGAAAGDGETPLSPALPHSAAHPAHPAASLALADALGLGLVGAPGTTTTVGGGSGAPWANPARVASPDGSASVTGDGTPAPSSTVGSPAPQAGSFGPRSQSPTEAFAALTLLSAPASPSPAQGRPRTRSRSISPHCKFAPLPKIDNLERPGTRRNSSVQGTPLVSRARVEAQEEQFALDLDDSLSAPAPFLLSNASMGLVAGASRPGGLGSTPSRRGSASGSGRSSSPSPIRRSGSTASSRSHSPIHSRHSSTEALHLHYISGATRSSNRSSSRERTSGTATPSDVLRAPPSAPASGRASPANAHEAASSPVLDLASTSTLPALFSAVAAAAAPLDAGTTPTPRRTVFVEPPPPSDPRELDELEEEDGEDDEDDEDDEDGSDDEEDEDGDEEMREEDPDDGSADEDTAERKTSKGAAVEVVHWHKGENTS